MGVVLAIGFAAVLLRLVDVQGLSSSRYAVLGNNQRLHTIDLAAPRGAIFDRHGAALAVSVSRATVWADPQLVSDPAGAARALAPLLRIDEAGLRASLTTNSRFVYLARRLDDETADAVRALSLAGVDLMAEPTRVWPGGTVASSVLGQVGVDDQGLSGLELQFQDELSGTPGEVLVERDPGGRDIPGGVRRRTEPVSGHGVVLTLDRDLQYFAEQTLGRRLVSSKARAGVAVVMDTQSGDILAMANMVAGEKDQAPHPAGYNKAVVDVYEPGSVNKLVTLAAAIEEKAVAPSTGLIVPDHITVGGSTFEDSESHLPQRWTPADIMAHSSNAGAIIVAQQLGRQGLDRYLRSFGLDREPGLDFPGEATGIVPDLGDWSATSLPTLAIGYGLAVTPLHMVAAYNAVANGGVYVEPRLVRAELDSSGKERAAPAADQHRVVSAETAGAVTGMLTQAVQDGTGTTAAIDGYTVAGKTGTARKAEGGTGYRDGAYNASFVGFVPAEAPRLSITVVLDEPQPYYGGLVAAPVFAELANYAVRHYQIPPRQAAATLRSSSATRP
ncbi:MAG: peptidoglycan D,D-transpeptidase FtsI family protein [Acidimicrobiales bacterium]